MLTSIRAVIALALALLGVMSAPMFAQSVSAKEGNIYFTGVDGRTLQITSTGLDSDPSLSVDKRRAGSSVSVLALGSRWKGSWGDWREGVRRGKFQGRVADWKMRPPSSFHPIAVVSRVWYPWPKNNDLSLLWIGKLPIGPVLRL